MVFFVCRGQGVGERKIDFVGAAIDYIVATSWGIS